MCKNIFTNENEFDLNGPITEDGVHYYGFGCSQHATGFGPYTPCNCLPSNPSLSFDFNEASSPLSYYYGFGHATGFLPDLRPNL